MSVKRLFLLLFFCAAAGAQNIFTIAGIPYSHRDALDGRPALSAPLGNVHGLLFDKTTGRLLFSDRSVISRLEPDGNLLALVGRGLSGQDGSTADGTLASYLNSPGMLEMTEDSAGALYVSDIFLGRVFRVALDGTVTTFAGGGTLAPGFASDGGPATAARLNSPRGLVFDSKGNLDIAEVICSCIRRVSPAGIISTVITLPASQYPNFTELEGLAIDAQDNLYFTEWMGHVVVRVAPNGAMTTIAGTGTAGFSGDGGPASAAQLNGPSGVALAPDGSIYIADSGNNRIRKIAPDGTISTIAGSDGTIANLNLPPPCAFAGDGGLAPQARLCNPAELVFDSNGNLYVSDYGNARVRVISPAGIISTIAGSGQPDTTQRQSSGDGGPAIHAIFNRIGGLVSDAAGNLYVSDSAGNRIRRIAPDGSIKAFSQGSLSGAGPLAMDAQGALYAIGNDQVWKIAPDGTTRVIAGSGPGSGINRSQGDGGPAVSATLNEPGGVAFDAQGNVFIADTSNARVRKVDPSGTISTVAGPGQLGTDYYNAVAVDPQNNLLLAWTHAAVYPAVTTNSIIGTVNRVGPGGVLTPVVGSGQPCTGGPFGLPFQFDGSPALQTQLCEVPAMTLDKTGNMYLAYGAMMLRIGADGIVHVIAGDPKATASGDGGPALQAAISPGSPAFDAAGNMFFPEGSRIREVTAAAYQLKLSLDHIGLADSTPQTWGVATSANFAEPFPYSVHVTTASGGSWLTTNRVTGLVGEPVTVRINPTGLPYGTYQGTVSVIMLGKLGQVDIPVTLYLPQ